MKTCTEVGNSVPNLWKGVRRRLALSLARFASAAARAARASRSGALRFGPMCGYSGGSFAGACPGAGGCCVGAVVFLPRSPHAPSTRAAPTSIANKRITVIRFDLTSEREVVARADAVPSVCARRQPCARPQRSPSNPRACSRCVSHQPACAAGRTDCSN